MVRVGVRVEVGVRLRLGLGLGLGFRLGLTLSASLAFLRAPVLMTGAAMAERAPSMEASRPSAPPSCGATRLAAMSASVVATPLTLRCFLERSGPSPVRMTSAGVIGAPRSALCTGDAAASPGR